MRWRVAGVVIAGHEQLDGPLHRAYAMHAVPLAAGNGDALDRAAERFEVIGAQLLAAEAYAEACAAHRDHRNALSARSAAKAKLFAELFPESVADRWHAGRATRARTVAGDDRATGRDRHLPPRGAPLSGPIDSVASGQLH